MKQLDPRRTMLPVQRGQGMSLRVRLRLLPCRELRGYPVLAPKSPQERDDLSCRTAPEGHQHVPGMRLNCQVKWYQRSLSSRRYPSSADTFAYDVVSLCE